MIKDFLKKRKLSPESMKRVIREQLGLFRTLDRRCEGKATLSIVTALGRIMAWMCFSLNIDRKELFKDVRASFDFFYAEYKKTVKKNET